MQHVDYAIVGGGSTGAVLANRLSAGGRRQVMLIESGRDLVPGQEPADIRNVFPLSTFNSDYQWPDLKVHWRRRDNSPLSGILQGRILGGGGSIMGMVAMRGHPADYEGWRERGASGWGWDEVLPYFRKLETDIDFQGPEHGDGGPLPIRRVLDCAQWPPLARAVAQAMQRRQAGNVADMNTDFSDGHFIMPATRFENARASAGICYLTADVRARPNLRVLTDSHVTRLTLDGRRITGVVYRDRGGQEHDVAAGETIVAAGALQTPVLLLRAGIGPAGELAAAGVPPLLDRAGVGRNLQNHLIVVAVAFLKREGLDALGWRPPAPTGVRWSSGLQGCPPVDMQLYIRSFLAWHALGRRMAMIAPVLMRPASTGSVRLGRDGRANPVIEFNFLDDERDLVRLMAGFRMAADLFREPEVRAIAGDAIVLEKADKLMRYNDFKPINAVRGWLASAALDVSPALGHALLSRLAHLRPVSEFAGDDTALADFIKASVTGTYHVCGTCRMGREDDPQAVVDPAGKVMGMDGLRIGDTSVMPTVPAANTHLPAVMVAEKIADAILRAG